MARVYTTLPHVPPAELTERVFLLFEDRGRDISGLLEFGSVVQVFDSASPWQVPSDALLASGFTHALQSYFATHGFTDADYVVAMGDPVAIAAAVHEAARVNGGRVRVLRWERLPCPSCRRFATINRTCPTHRVTGRYVTVPLVFSRATR